MGYTFARRPDTLHDRIQRQRIRNGLCDVLLGFIAFVALCLAAWSTMQLAHLTTWVIDTFGRL